MCNVPLDAPMCPLQIINDIEPLNFIQYLSNVENYLTGHKSETNRPKKNGPLENILLHLYTGFGVKIQNTKWPKIFVEFF